MSRTVKMFTLLLWAGATYHIAPAVMAGELADGIWAGDSLEQVASQMDGYDCSLLISPEVDSPGDRDEDTEDTATAYCVDTDIALDVRGGHSRVYFDEHRASRLVVEYPLSAASYTTVLALLRRQGLVFVWMDVAGETLDVLAASQTLDPVTLDSQLFALANRYDYHASRRYLMLDHDSYRHALQVGVIDTLAWFGQGPGKSADGNDAIREQTYVADFIVTEDQITVSYHFVGEPLPER